MQGPISLPIGTQFVENLDKFQIIVGQDDFELQPSQRALMVSKFDVSQELKKDNCLKELLKEADFLALRSATVSNIVPELDKEGYRDLSRLELSNIDSMSRICEGKAPTELFYNLCHLAVSKLENLEVLLPINPLPLKMTTLGISDCNSLTYIFSEDNVANKESDIIKLLCLKTLELDGVSNLISFVKESNNDDRQRPGFFNNKVALTSLEKLSLRNNMRIVKLWDEESNLRSFQNLKVLNISGCEEMESIGPPSMFRSLVQLETLSINNCEKMQQVISDGSETQEIRKEIIPFPKLKSLDINRMKNLECFYDGSCKMAFPSLETLDLNCKRMTKFAGGTSSTAFFPKTIEFPYLEKLYLFELSDEVSVLWDLPEGEDQGISSNPLPNLKTLYIRKIKLPSIVFPSLSWLSLEAVGDGKFLFSSSSENEGCLGRFSQFPKLEELRIEGCPGSVKQFIEEDGSTAMLNFCGQLRSLNLQSALNMEVVSLHLFKSFRDIYSQPMGGFQQLQSLEELTIYKCPNLEVIIRGGDKDTTFVFPQLKELDLWDLERMSKLCSISDIPLHFPSLESLTIGSCNQLESLFSGEPNQVVELPSLEYVTIRYCDAMKSLSTRPLKAPNLRQLYVSNCPEMEWFLSGNADLELPSLEYVTIKNCPNMKSFSPALLRASRLREFSVEKCNKWEWLFDGEPNQVVELPSLEEVTIDECDALKSFSIRPLKAPKLRKLKVYNCPEIEWFSFINSNCNADLELPSLEEVSIMECPNMKSFSLALLRTPRLRKLRVAECNNWEWFFDGEPNQVVELPSLEKVFIRDCDAMKSFSTRPLKAPKLRKLVVFSCPEMEWFLSGNSNCNADLELPSLEDVIIMECPKMKSISPAVLRAPKLQLVEVDDKPYPIAETEDLNHVFQSANSSEQTDKTDL